MFTENRILSFLRNLSRREIVSLGITLFLLIGLGGGVYLVGRSQEIRKKAKDTGLSAVAIYKKPILIIELLIDRLNSKIEIISINKALGFSPDYNNPLPSDILSVYIESKTGVKRQISVPLPSKEVYAPPRKKGEILNYPQRQFDKYNYTIIVPFESEEKIDIFKNFSSDF